jgi:hypothetical protein
MAVALLVGAFIAAAAAVAGGRQRDDGGIRHPAAGRSTVLAG